MPTITRTIISSTSVKPRKRCGLSGPNDFPIVIMQSSQPAACRQLVPGLVNRQGGASGILCRLSRTRNCCRRNQVTRRRAGVWRGGNHIPLGHRGRYDAGAYVKRGKVTITSCIEQITLLVARDLEQITL